MLGLFPRRLEGGITFSWLSENTVFQLNHLPQRWDLRGKNLERWAEKWVKERREEIKRKFSFPALKIKVELTANS